MNTKTQLQNQIERIMRDWEAQTYGFAQEYTSDTPIWTKELWFNRTKINAEYLIATGTTELRAFFHDSVLGIFVDQETNGHAPWWHSLTKPELQHALAVLPQAMQECRDKKSDHRKQRRPEP